MTQYQHKLECGPMPTAQRDGRPGEYRWRPLRKFRNSIACTRRKAWLTPAGEVPCSNAANIGERKSWT